MRAVRERVADPARDCDGDTMKGDRVEAVVDTGQGTRTFEITASRAGRRLEVTSGRGIVEVTEVTRSGTPVRTGRFMANRLIALVEHPALESDGAGVEVSTRRRLGRSTTPAGQLTLASRSAAVRTPRRSRAPAGEDADVGGQTAVGEHTAVGDEAAIGDDMAVDDEADEPGQSDL